jgi:hypothetical protein
MTFKPEFVKLIPWDKIPGALQVELNQSYSEYHMFAVENVHESVFLRNHFKAIFGENALNEQDRSFLNGWFYISDVNFFQYKVHSVFMFEDPQIMLEMFLRFNQHQLSKSMDL